MARSERPTMNERQGKPSASSMERYALCPGSYAAERGLSDVKTEDSASGDRIHAALAGQRVEPPLTDDEETTRAACQKRAAELTDSLVPNWDAEFFERRFWWNEILSGQPDLVRVDYTPGTALVIDYKTGRGEVTSADGNLQLRTLAVLVAHTCALKRIIVAIVQPLAGPNSVCLYDEIALERARSEIMGILDSIHKPDAQRRPSFKACQYCKAKATCLEAREASVALPLANIPEGTTASAIAATLTGETLGEFLKRAEFAVKVIDACRDEARRRLETGETVPGWKLKPGSVRETITDPTKVFTRFAELGGTQDKFLPCVSVTKGKLKDAVKAATGAKGKALDEQLDAMLNGCTESKPTSPSLAREDA